MGDVTRILSSIESGDTEAAEQLLPLVYEELRRLAATKMAQEASDHTLQPTALVHEAYVRLVDVEQVQQWDSRGHFFCAAAEAMRRILVENARRKRTRKRAADRQPVEMSELTITIDATAIDLLALNQALEALESREPAKAELVKLRFFAGLTVAEAADLMGISRATANRYWIYARAWLHSQIGDADES